MVDLLFTKQENPAWGTNVVILEQVCRGKQREDALCLKIKMEREIIRWTFLTDYISWTWVFLSVKVSYILTINSPFWANFRQFCSNLLLQTNDPWLRQQSRLIGAEKYGLIRLASGEREPVSWSWSFYHKNAFIFQVSIMMILVFLFLIFWNTRQSLFILILIERLSCLYIIEFWNL